jgi:hypothetical protein
MDSFENNFNNFLSRSTSHGYISDYEINNFEKPKSETKYVQKELKIGNLTYKKTKYKHKT